MIFSHGEARLCSVCDEWQPAAVVFNWLSGWPLVCERCFASRFAINGEWTKGAIKLGAKT